MTGRDKYYNRSKQEGYRARSAYKLRQIDEATDLLAPGATVVDLGAAPGGWLQVAAEAVGEGGHAVGVDRQRIDPLEDGEAGADSGATVETVRGDVTDADTRERIREVAGEVDAVLSDMAPEMTGEYSVDHARSIHLAREALETAEAVLRDGGHLAVKVFDGRDLEAFREDLEAEFEYARALRPEASRDSSSELYLVGKRRLTAPVRAGDTVEVEIVDTGEEGDGVARVDGFTLFVPGADEGEVLVVEVTDVKERFGFAEPAG
jgi:23S rRNA (uridine2552-2'-O)-methyltransferase